MVQLYFNPRQYRFDPNQSGTNPLRSKSLIRITILIRPIKILIWVINLKFLFFQNFIGGPEFRPNFDPLYVEILVRKCFKTVVNFDRAVVGKLTQGPSEKHCGKCILHVWVVYCWISFTKTKKKIYAIAEFSVAEFSVELEQTFLNIMYPIDNDKVVSIISH